jgi:hypothetical protein
MIAPTSCAAESELRARCGNGRPIAPIAALGERRRMVVIRRLPAARAEVSSNTGSADADGGQARSTEQRGSASWTERGGPTMSPPERRGFGTVVMQEMVEHSVDGDVDLDYAPSGLTWRLSCPAAIALERSRARESKVTGPRWASQGPILLGKPLASLAPRKALGTISKAGHRKSLDAKASMRFAAPRSALPLGHVVRHCSTLIARLHQQL